MQHLPEVLPDETLYSLLARIAAVNGFADHLKVLEKLFGHKTPSSIVTSSVGMERFCSFTDGVYGTIDTVRFRLTAYPLLSHLNVFPLYEYSTNPNLATWLDGSAFDYSGNTRNEWRECPKCCDDDEANLGFSYWRRYHQLPTTYYCLTHGVPLRRSIVHRKRLHDRFWLPHELDAIAVAPDSLKIEPNAAMILATIGRDVLNDSAEPFHPDVIRDAFIGAIKDRNLLTRAGKIRWPDCLRDFYNTVNLVECSTPVPERAIRQLLMGLQTRKASGAIQDYVLLVAWLFGTWQYFRECCRWVETINYPDGRLKCNKGAVNAEKDRIPFLEIHRRVCINYMRNNPTASRSDFLKHEYKSFRWLLHNDSKWLDNHLPLNLNKIENPTLF